MYTERKGKKYGSRLKQQEEPEISKLANKIIKNTEKILNKQTMEDVELFLDLSEKFGKQSKGYRIKGKYKSISTSQIRGIFNEVKRLPDKFEKCKINLNLLRPKLAYQKGRFDELEPLTRVLIHLIKNVKNDATLKGFKEFFEAIIAYHKAAGGD